MTFPDVQFFLGRNVEILIDFFCWLFIDQFVGGVAVTPFIDFYFEKRFKHNSEEKICS